MEKLFEVHAKSRTDLGKGANRRLRHAGNIPAIMYGANTKPVALVINHNKLIRHLEEEAFYAHILTLIVDGKKNRVVLKDLQRHPASMRKIIHADFLRIDDKHAMTMVVPLHFTGGDIAPGVKQGGIVSHLMTDIEISCLPKDLPEYIEVDLSTLELDATIHLSEIVLPKGVSSVALSHTQSEDLAEGERSPYDQAIVSIHTPRIAVEAEDSPAEEDTEETEDNSDE